MWGSYQRILSLPSRKIFSVTKIQCFRTFLSAPMPEIEKFGSGIKSYEDLYKFSVEKPEIFWNEMALRLDWKQKFSSVVQGDFNSGVRWFVNGKLNASENCVDRHAARNPNGIALIYEKDEPNQHEQISFGQLKEMVVHYAYILRTVANVAKGDRVALYMPNSINAVAFALACARLGAIHSVAFAGFSAHALASRINDAKATTVITTDILVRGGKTSNVKHIVDEALESCPSVKTVIVASRDGDKSRAHMVHPRDHFLEDLLNDAKRTSILDHIEYVDSNDPLFILYTSGSTGAPKGLMHSTAGYLLYASMTHQQVFDCRKGDKFGCVADIGWITGHSYIIYAPLANGVTSLLFESTPIYPNPGRYWETIERLRLTHFYCSPTAIRLLMKYGTEWVEKHDRSSLRVLGVVGEPINVEAWEWFNNVVGEKRCTLVDTWWQTETGGICMSPRPSGTKDVIEPAIPMRPLFGIKPKIMANENDGNKTGEGPLCIEKPWPGMAISIWGSPERFRETYFSPFPNYYFTGDGAICNERGFWKITGRIDDVINVKGHRLGTTEVEEAIHQHSLVNEIAVVGYPHDIKGEGIFAYVVLKHTKEKIDEGTISNEVKALCKSEIAGYAVPDYIMFAEGLPKTRSGKMMRRILRKIAAGGSSLEDMGDISTLADPSVLEPLIQQRKKMK